MENITSILTTYQPVINDIIKNVLFQLRSNCMQNFLDKTDVSPSIMAIANAYNLALKNADAKGYTSSDISVFLDFDDTLFIKWNQEYNKSEDDLLEEMQTPGISEEKFQELLAASGNVIPTAFSGAIELLHMISEAGSKLYIMTQREYDGKKGKVQTALRNNNILDLFSEVLHVRAITDDQPEIVGNKKYIAEPGKTITLSKGAIMREFILKMPILDQPKFVVFADDIKDHVDFAFEEFFPNDGRKHLNFNIIFVYKEGKKWDIMQRNLI